jgi:hypothetical protein
MSMHTAPDGAKLSDAAIETTFIRLVRPASEQCWWNPRKFQNLHTAQRSEYALDLFVADWRSYI